MKNNIRTTALRRTILTAATSVLQIKGYANTTMEDIATAAGTSKGNIYNYFSSKHDLFVALLQDHFTSNYWVKPELLESPLPPTEKLRELVKGILQGVSSSSQLGPLLLDYWAAAAREPFDGSLTASITGMLDRYRDVFKAVLDEVASGGRKHRSVDSATLASFIQTAIAGFIMISILDRKSHYTQKELDEFINCLTLVISAN
ncbi:MAG TPA: TetR/AcrR family transcriptional regulator [Phycisphaerae bacterium]|nr:TetR/AcrR family transcriptional regulator [Phycisphaerae bacterium]